MQAQRLIRMFCQVFAHDADTLFHQVIAAGDQRWQIAGAARFLVGFLHNFQRFNRHRFCGIVKLDTAAAVKLYVDETGGQSGHWRLQSHGHPEFHGRYKSDRELKRTYRPPVKKSDRPG
ncbi:Uncharacterised protein [Enterobacter cloacae]|nr:Uncharacterised protein [Enterobacter cloacae]